MITKKLIQDADSYSAYKKRIDVLLSENKTTGANHSEVMLNYTNLNVHRMKRLDKTTIISQELSAVMAKIQTPQIWLVISGAWCGDAAQNLPVINSVAQHSDAIDLKIILRDEHPEIMDKYLTNGGKSIPKLIMLDAKSLTEIAVWGPRPIPTQEMVLENKKTQTKSHDDLNKDLQLWCVKDKTQTIQNEIVDLLM
ncbi:MAG: thioredoxin family protein [Flavobacteriales bacterium]|nr:thioredoxin family protein [Flavobacteriales bacterium]